MLEKDKSKRAFVIDLFSKFPRKHFKIENALDEKNFEFYNRYKATMDRKRVIDGNMHKIHEQYNELKKCLKDDIDEEKRERAILNFNTRQSAYIERGPKGGKSLLDSSTKHKFQRMTSMPSNDIAIESSQL